MAIRWTSVAITTDSLGAGTATTAAPVIGEIREVRVNAQQFSSTADYTIRRNSTQGGTVAYILNNNGPFSVSPGVPVYSTGDGLAVAGLYGTATYPPISDSPLTVVVAQGGSVTSGTVYIASCGE